MARVRIDQGNVSLAMNVQGPRKGPTVLFLHAGGESRSVWSPIFSRLRPQHWQLVAPDLRGHGESDRAEKYVFDDFVADVFGIMKNLKGRPLVLVGSSFGGLMALMLAKHHPKLVDGLVLLDAPSCLSVATAKQESQKIVDVGSRKGGTFSHLDPQLASGQLAEGTTSEPECLSLAAQSISVPTLFLYGSRSKVVGKEELHSLQRDIPHVETVEVDAGHLIARDNPQAVAEELAAFIPTLIREAIH